MELATFGGGCFWGVEYLFRQQRGVLDVMCGYMGGCLPNPSYEEVCSHRTGHAEVVQVQFDPTIVSYEKLLDFFWSIHDPTTFNQQGTDVGVQYRSIIFYHTPRQEQSARKTLRQLEEKHRFSRPITTHLCPAQYFYIAEEFHQRYFEKHPDKIACHTKIRPLSTTDS